MLERKWSWRENGDRKEERGCVQYCKVFVLSPSASALPTPLSLSLSLYLAWLPEKGVSACLPLKGREGSVHGYSSLLSFCVSVISLSLSFPQWQPQD